MPLHNPFVALWGALFTTLVTVCLGDLTVSPLSTPTDYRATLTFTLDQRCDLRTGGLTSLTITVPSNALDLKVQPVPGWNVAVEGGARDPTRTRGESERNVTYTGVLQAGAFEMFRMRAFVFGEGGKPAYFRAYQDCGGNGDAVRWDVVPTTDNPMPLHRALSVEIIGQHAAAAETAGVAEREYVVSSRVGLPTDGMGDGDAGAPRGLGGTGEEERANGLASALNRLKRAIN